VRAGSSLVRRRVNSAKRRSAAGGMKRALSTPCRVPRGGLPAGHRLHLRGMDQDYPPRRRLPLAGHHGLLRDSQPGNPPLLDRLHRPLPAMATGRVPPRDLVSDAGSPPRGAAVAPPPLVPQGTHGPLHSRASRPIFAADLLPAPALPKCFQPVVAACPRGDTESHTAGSHGKHLVAPTAPASSSSVAARPSRFLRRPVRVHPHAQ
jgi:hypothetical protein